MGKGPEHRKHQRVRPRGVVAHVRSPRPFACQVENLSRGGVFIRTDQTVPVGSVIELDLVKPGARKALRLSGTVVRLVEADAAQATAVPGMAVEFVAPSDEDALKLQELMSALGIQTGKIANPAQARPDRPSDPDAKRTTVWPEPQSRAVKESTGQPQPSTGAAKEARSQGQSQAAAKSVATARRSATGSVPLAPELFEPLTSGPPQTDPFAAVAALQDGPMGGAGSGSIPRSEPSAPAAPPRKERSPAATTVARAQRAASSGAASAVASPEQASAAGAASESARLMVQIRGLLFELGELRARLEEREAELKEARAELAKLRGGHPIR